MVTSTVWERTTLSQVRRVWQRGQSPHITGQHAGGGGWSEHGCRGEHLVGKDRPENGTDPPGFDGEKIFLTLCSHKAVATITNASSIYHTQRAIALRSSFLWVERMMGGAE